MSTNLTTSIAARRARRAAAERDALAWEQFRTAAGLHGEEAAAAAAGAAIARAAADGNVATLADAAAAAWENGKQARTNAVRSAVRRSRREHASGLAPDVHDGTLVIRESAADAAERVTRIMGAGERPFTTIVTRYTDGRPADLTIVPMSARAAAYASDGAVAKADDGIGGRAPGRSGTGWKGDHAGHALAGERGTRAPRERATDRSVAVLRETSLVAMSDPTRNHYANHKGSQAYTDPTAAAAMADPSTVLALVDLHTDTVRGRRGVTVDWAAVAAALGTDEYSARTVAAGLLAARRPADGDIVKRARAAAIGAADLATAASAGPSDGMGRVRPAAIVDTRPARTVAIVEGPAAGWHRAGRIGRKRANVAMLVRDGRFRFAAEEVCDGRTVRAATLTRPAVSVATAGRRVRITRPAAAAVTV